MKLIHTPGFSWARMHDAPFTLLDGIYRQWLLALITYHDAIVFAQGPEMDGRNGTWSTRHRADKRDKIGVMKNLFKVPNLDNAPATWGAFFDDAGKPIAASFREARHGFDFDVDDASTMPTLTTRDGAPANTAIGLRHCHARLCYMRGTWSSHNPFARLMLRKLDKMLSNSVTQWPEMPDLEAINRDLRHQLLVAESELEIASN